MHKFDYSFLKTINVPVSFLTFTNKIYELNNEEKNIKKTNEKVFISLKKNAIYESVKSSNAIEGVFTSEKRLKEIVNDNVLPLTHSEKEINGYKNALNLIHENYDNLFFNEEDILSLHKIIFEDIPNFEKGKYKSEDNVIKEILGDGSSRISFEPVKAKDTKKAMDELFLAYKIARSDSEINQLLLIPCVILDFLCIHPFLDGNGRMSRLLSILLLYHDDFDIMDYISFENEINKNKIRYYSALSESSYLWHENKNDYIPFINNFLMTLFFNFKELDKRFLTLKSGHLTKEKRIEEVILSSFIPLSKKEISSLLPDVSISTIERTLNNLLKEEKIKKLGNTNSVKYIKNKNL